MEEMLTLKDAARLLTGRGGKRPHTETVRRWITHGYKCPTGGEVVRLKAVRVSGTWLMERKWVDAFYRARLLGGMMGCG